MKKKKRQIQKAPTEPPYRKYLKVGFKYGYLLVFFMLLSGFFHPLITGFGGEDVVIGVLILAMGLFGVAMIHHAVTAQSRPVLYAGIGLGITTVTMYVILLV